MISTMAVACFALCNVCGGAEPQAQPVENSVIVDLKKLKVKLVHEAHGLSKPIIGANVNEVDISELPRIFELISRIPTLTYINFGSGIKHGDLTEVRRLDRIDYVGFSACSIDAKQFSALGKMKSLTRISLNECEFAPGSSKGLRDCTQIESLTVQTCSGWDSDDFAFIEFLPKLTAIAIGNASQPEDRPLKFDDAAAAFLQRSKSLESVALRRTNVSTQVFAVFEAMPSLKKIYLPNSDIPRTELLDFQKKHPELNISFPNFGPL